MSPTITALTNTQREHFLERGHVILRGCFPRDVAQEWFDWGYHRTGLDPNDPSQWEPWRIHLAGRRFVNVEEFAPTAYHAIGELSGGIERLHEPLQWADSFIFNQGFRKDEPWLDPTQQDQGWHKDGDFFRHYLDSPEQGLLVIVLWSEVKPKGGGTFIACDSVPLIARYLAERPEGVLPNAFPFKEFYSQCHDFAEVTGEPGDVVLLHPYMLHTVSQNAYLKPRIITNPPVSLKEPMQFNRADGDYSLVEQVVLRALGVDHYDFQPTGDRERLTPARKQQEQEALAAEKARLGET